MSEIKLSKNYLQYVFPEYKKKGVLPGDLLELIISYLCHITDEDGNRIPWVNDTIHGVATFRTSTDILIVETPMVNGKIHGIKRIYDNDGHIREEIPCVHGYRHGTYKKWDCNGELIETFYYNNPYKKDNGK